jgi:phospholipase/carboxylesterase
MLMTADQATSHAGLIYRVRRGTWNNPPLLVGPRGPLIFMLHGLSGDENVMWLFDHALPRSATVISPRALFASAAGYSWARSVVRDEVEQADFAEAIEALQHFIPEMIQRYEVEAQRIIVLGFSQGAALSYALSLTQPEWLRGVIALAGFMPFDATRSARRTPDALHRTGCERNVAESKSAWQPRYLIIHGVDDDIVPIALAREARSVLEARGALIEYHEYPGGGHKVSAQGMKDIAQWITTTLREG